MFLQPVPYGDSGCAILGVSFLYTQLGKSYPLKGSVAKIPQTPLPELWEMGLVISGRVFPPEMVGNSQSRGLWC